MRVVSPLVILLVQPLIWGQSYDISTFAGGALPALPAPALSVSTGDQYGIAVDQSGNLYIPNELMSAVYKIALNGSLTLIAGNGYCGFNGDGGPATSAEMCSPGAVAVDLDGNVYVADETYGVVREISSSGVISTFAGNGTTGYSGDGGPAISAGLSGARGLVADAIGNVYIADTGNYVIRKVSINGTISTVAGNGSPGYSGDGGPATSAKLSGPLSVAVDSEGNLYIADSENNRIREVSAAGIITTFAGNGVTGNSGNGGPATNAELNYPSGVAVDAIGNVWISDTGNAQIREVSTSGVITTVAGGNGFGFKGDGGPAISATLESPGGLSLNPQGDLLIADQFRVREVDTSGNINTVAGNGLENYGGDGGPAIDAQLDFPGAVAASPLGGIYIADSANYLIRAVNNGGVITSIAGNGILGDSGDNGPATNAELDYVSGMAFDSAGNLYIEDPDFDVVRRISASGIITTFAGNGDYGYSGDGGPAVSASLSIFYYPSGIAVDAAGDLFIADSGNNVIRKVDSSGTITTVAGNGTAGFLGDGGPATSAQLSVPEGVAVDSNGNLYIADTGNVRVREVYAATGTIATVAGNGEDGYNGDGGPATAATLYMPRSIVVDGNASFYFTDSGDEVIRKVNSAGIITTIAGTGIYGYAGDGGPATAADLNDPQGLGVGPNGVIYVADTINLAIRALTPCAITVSTSVLADSTAQTISTPVTADSSCQWGVTSVPSWISTSSIGGGPGTLSLSLQANSTGTDRTAIVQVNGVGVSVKQEFTAEVFNDVPPADYFFDAVNLLSSANITAGCGTTDFCPTVNVTRDQMAVFLVKTVYGPNSFTYSPTPYFTDVPTTYWAFPFIQKLYELNITAGCATMLYCPTATVTRDQMAVFIIKARYGAGTPFTWNPTPYFTDVPPTEFAFACVQRMYQDGITAGCSSTPFDYCPGSAVIRGDMAVFLIKGGFNELLAPTAPVITSIRPAALPAGTTAMFTVTGANTAFQQGMTSLVFSPASGITVNSISVTSPAAMTVSLTAASTAPQQPQSIYEQTGPAEAVLPNGLLIQ